MLHELRRSILHTKVWPKSLTLLAQACYVSLSAVHSQQLVVVENVFTPTMLDNFTRYLEKSFSRITTHKTTQYY